MFLPHLFSIDIGDWQNCSMIWYVFTNNKEQCLRAIKVECDNRKPKLCSVNCSTKRFITGGHLHSCVKRGLLLTLNILTSAYIFSILFSIHFLRCWQGEFLYQLRASLGGDHLFYSHNLNVWFRGDIVRRNKILVTLRGQRVQELLHLVIISFILITLMCDSGITL